MNIKKQQTDTEFYTYFQDVLASQIKKTCKSTDLVFLTLQPQQLYLNSKTLSEHTATLFNKMNYVEVREQNFKVSKRYDVSDYIDGWHSHLILEETDYEKRKGALVGYDIKVKPIYDLPRLIMYLAKQAVRNRLLPVSSLFN